MGLARRIQSKLKGQPEKTYRAGDAFYEQPYMVHEIGRNASNSKRATLLAIHICDKNAPLTIPVAEHRR